MYDYDYDYDYRYSNRWVALDERSDHPVRGCRRSSDDDINSADQISEIDQSSNEVIIIKDSCEVTVETTNFLDIEPFFHFAHYYT